MNLTTLVSLLESTGYRVVFSNFRVSKHNQSPEPPYIIYTTPSDPTFKADNKVFYKMIDVDIELYTDKKDFQAERAIESVLDDNEIPYDSYQVFIESENLYQKTYEIRLM